MQPSLLGFCVAWALAKPPPERISNRSWRLVRCGNHYGVLQTPGAWH